MAENSQKSDATIPGKGKRRTVGRVLDVVFTLPWVLVYIAVLRTGYLSWIGIAVATYVVMLTVASHAFSFTGKKRLEMRSIRLMSGTMIVAGVSVLAVLLWPEGDEIWRPYRFDDELDALEAKRAMPDQDNAALNYESLFAEIDVNDRLRSFLRKRGRIRDEFSKYPWKGIDHPEVSQWIDSDAETIDKLLLIGKMEKCRWPIQADIYDEDTVPYKPLHYCTQLLRAAGNRDLGEGRLLEALEKSFCILQMADHLYQQTQILDFYYGRALEMNALEMIRYILVQNDLSHEDAEQIIRYLPLTADTRQQNWSKLIEYEKLRYMNLMVRVYEITNESEVRFAAGITFESENRGAGENRGRKDRLWRFYWSVNMPLNPKHIRDTVDRYFAGFGDLFESDYMSQIDDNRMPSFWSLDSLSKVCCNFLRWGIENFIFDGEEYVRLSCHFARRITHRRGTWLVLGLREYRNAHGEWPESLNRISEYVPGEAFLDPTNNDAFVYALEGDGFKLYSKGTNGIDEGGRRDFVFASEDDIMIWPLDEKGDEK